MLWIAWTVLAALLGLCVPVLTGLWLRQRARRSSASITAGPIALPVRVERGPAPGEWVLVDARGAYAGNSSERDVLETIARALNTPA